MRYAIVKDGSILNFVEWDGGDGWSPEAGCEAHAFDGAAGIGRPWNDGDPINPDPPEPTPENPVPRLVTSGSFIRAAHELDWLDAIDAAVAAIGQQNSLVPLLWARASQFERNHPFVTAVAQAMGKTSDEVDDLFRLASTYDA